MVGESAPLTSGLVVSAIASDKPILTFRDFSLRCDKSDPKISFQAPWNWELPRGRKVAVISENSFLRYQLTTSIAGLIAPVSGEFICSGVVGWPIGGEGGVDKKMRVSHALDFLSAVYEDCLEASIVSLDQFWDLLSGMEVDPRGIIGELARPQKDFFFLALSTLFSFDFYLIPQTRFLMSREARLLKALLLNQLQGKTLIATSTNRRFQEEFCSDGLVIGSSGQLLFAGGLLEAIQWSDQNLTRATVSESDDESFGMDLMFSNSEPSGMTIDDDGI